MPSCLWRPMPAPALRKPTHVRKASQWAAAHASSLYRFQFDWGLRRIEPGKEEGVRAPGRAGEKWQRHYARLSHDTHTLRQYCCVGKRERDCASPSSNQITVSAFKISWPWLCVCDRESIDALPSASSGLRFAFDTIDELSHSVQGFVCRSIARRESVGRSLMATSQDTFNRLHFFFFDCCVH